MRRRKAAIAAAALAVVAGAAAAALVVDRGPGPEDPTAASHREAPLIAQDPTADVSDFYFFTDPEDSSKVVAIMNVNPFSEPSAGPNWYAFSNTALYAIHFDNDGDGKPDVSYEFKFKDVAKNVKPSPLPLGCVALKCQTLNAWRIKDGKGGSIASNVPVASVDIGPRTRQFLQGGVPDYATVRAQTIKQHKDGGLIFAGPADDPFFGDIGAAFDAVGIRSGTGGKGGGKDTFAGFNVHTIAIQLPKSAIRGKGDVVGAWGAVYRPKAVVEALGKSSAPVYRSGKTDYIQVSRLGNPLFNELIVPTSEKDAWNAVAPDRDGAYAKYARTPLLAPVMNQLYASHDLNIPTKDRADLEAAFLTGLDLLGNRLQRGKTLSDALRLNLDTPSAGTPNRLGPLASDVQGWPNGRRLQDDVVDIALVALGGALFTPANVLALGDGVNGNDRAFLDAFPYVALPHEAAANGHGAEGAGGLRTTRLDVVYAAGPVRAGGPVSVEVADRTFAGRIGWREIVARAEGGAILTASSSSSPSASISDRLVPTRTRPSGAPSRSRRRRRP